MTTGNKILAGLLVLQVVVLVVVFWPRASDADGGKLFPDLEAVNVTAVTISDSEGRSIRLTRTPIRMCPAGGGRLPVRGKQAAGLSDKSGGYYKDLAGG